MSNRTRSLATFCVEEEHGHHTLEAGRVETKDCRQCREESEARTGQTIHVITAKVTHTTNRGHVLRVSPETIERTPSGTSRGFMLFSGPGVRGPVVIILRKGDVA